VTQDARAAAEYGLARVTVLRSGRDADRIVTHPPGTIGWGGNSGFQALNLAVQWGAARILLVGYDLRLDHGIHWHGPHGAGLHNPNDRSVARWAAVLDGQAERLAALGLDIVNTSPISALRRYRRASLEEAAC
jgi:hypothetical protein